MNKRSAYTYQSGSSPSWPTGGSNRAFPLQEMDAILEGIPDFVAVVSRDGTILVTNHAWDHELQQVGSSDFRVGTSYPEALAALISAGDKRVGPVLEAFRQISAGTRRSSQHLCYAYGVFSLHDYSVRLSSFDVADDHYVLVNIRDVTEVNELKRQRRRFDSGVLRAQESERRRMAREFHDSTSQLLVALQLNLMNLDIRARPETDSLISECKKVVKTIQREIRSISYIAHPPPLALNGLPAAFEALVAGFASRAGLTVDLQITDVGQASASVEAAIYRIAQEALSNIHRHASARAAKVRLVGKKHYIHLVIADDGIGFDPHSPHNGGSLGVGVLGMEERVRELGGRFAIRRLAQQTVLSVSLPRLKLDAAR